LSSVTVDRIAFMYKYRYVGIGCWFAPIAIRSQAS
jgi:hypothetical protein